MMLAMQVAAALAPDGGPDCEPRNVLAQGRERDGARVGHRRHAHGIE